MRELKFRAWNGESMLSWEKLKNLRYAIESENWIVCQYTGLKDENGKEIYEGDVIKAYDVLAKVQWNEEYASFEIEFGETKRRCFIFKLYEWKVIGNIYENPELLK